ncbi:MAG: hypothetical protein EOO96_25145 [Pedobacter sp.]|nr:MAG: hypothetical protein EOO96_25145 [Pedobacter sp.]
MGKNLNKPSYYATLFLGLLLSPFLSFSQQDEPKRVSVIVSAKEIAPEKEIVQIPADNTPKVVGKSFTKAVAKNPQTVVKKNTILVKTATAKEKPTVKPIIAANKKPPVANTVIAPVKNKAASPKIKIEEVANKKPAEKETVRKTTSIQKSVAATPKTETKTLATKSDEVSVQTNDKTITTAKANNENNELLENATTSKANSFSYIWIGIFLMVAGVVLGLLFGKPAFLISFVGIVFITLGLII